jgi:hypothetical protein
VDAELQHHSGHRNAPLVAIATGFLLGASLLYPPIRGDQAVAHLEFVGMGVGPAQYPLQVVVQARQRPLVKSAYSSMRYEHLKMKVQ